MRSLKALKRQAERQRTATVARQKELDKKLEEIKRNANDEMARNKRQQIYRDIEKLGAGGTETLRRRMR